MGSDESQFNVYVHRDHTDSYGRGAQDGHLKKRKQSWSETLEAEAENCVFYNLLFQQLWASSK